MKKDLWLPKGFQLSDGSAITTVLFSGEDWQIYETDGTNNVLLVKPCLQQKWVKLRLLEDALFANVDFGKTSLKALSSPKTYQLATLDGNISMPSKVDAMAFALALRSSRACSPDVSFHDAIYVEQYSKLLPTWTLTSFVEDDVVLGTWITGGVGVSAKSFRRLSNLVGWMSKDELAQVISAAGFPFSNDGNQLVMEESTVQNTVESKIDIGKRDSEHKLNDPLEKPTFKLPGRPMLEDFFNEHVIDIISHADQYSALGIDFPSAIVLYGPPGCGKTYAVERLVEFLDWPCYSIDSNTVGSPYIHATGKKISEMFDKAIDSAPSVLVIDEMESFLSDRQYGTGSGLHHIEEVAEFLRRIPEAIKNKVLIIGMTNLIDLIDPAILRRGRFDHTIEVGMPSKDEVASLVESLLSKLPKSSDLVLDGIIDHLTGKALSDTAFVIREAARLSAKAGTAQLTQESLEKALLSLPKDQTKKTRSIGFI